MKETSDMLLSYLRDMCYSEENADLDLDKLEKDFVPLGKGLMYLAKCISEYREFANALAKGDLNVSLPPAENELVSPLKSLHANLKHLAWQSQQVSKGDYKQRVDFMGEFADAFNLMINNLSDRQKELENCAYRDVMTCTYNRFYGMQTLDEWLDGNKQFALIFVDLDNLKYVNDKYGHSEGDEYIIRAAKHLQLFSENSVVCRIGGDEYMVLAPDTDYDEACCRMESIEYNIQNEEYLNGKDYYYSISHGIVVVEAGSGLSSSEVLSIADDRMYEHKRAKKKEWYSIA